MMNCYILTFLHTFAIKLLVQIIYYTDFRLRKMEGTPHRKKARFSEHPQIFEYSSKNKKQLEGDNDSMLLDMNEYQPVQKQNNQTNFQTEELDSNTERQLQIDQITSGLQQIEAYLQQQSKPLDQIGAQPQNIQVTPNKVPNNVREKNQRFSINFKPQLRNGRETMSIQQQMKVRSTIKDLPQGDISNNKKRMMKEQLKQKTIQERLQNEAKKNKRITMDVKELMNMLNQYKIEDDNNRKMRDQRKNRITMDVFALTKLIENAAQQDQQGNNQDQNTPIKRIQKSVRKSKVFSAFKQSPHSAEVKLFVNNYIMDVGKRLKDKQNDNRKMLDYIAQLKSELVKIQLKIADNKNRVEKRTTQKLNMNKKIKAMNQQLNKKKYLQDLEIIKSIEFQMGIKVLKYEINQRGYYGHFIFDGIYLKMKCQGKNGPIDMKLMISQKLKQTQKYFLISTDDAIDLIQKLNSKGQDRSQNFIQNVMRVKKSYNRIKKLDNDLQYFSLNFDLKEFELNSTLDKLSYQACFGGDKILLFEINMNAYLSNELDSKSILIYDPSKPGYLDLEVESSSSDSLVFEKMKKIIDIQII